MGLVAPRLRRHGRDPGPHRPQHPSKALAVCRLLARLSRSPVLLRPPIRLGSTHRHRRIVFALGNFGGCWGARLGLRACGGWSRRAGPPLVCRDWARRGRSHHDSSRCPCRARPRHPPPPVDEIVRRGGVLRVDVTGYAPIDATGTCIVLPVATVIIIVVVGFAFRSLARLLPLRLRRLLHVCLLLGRRAALFGFRLPRDDQQQTAESQKKPERRRTPPNSRRRTTAATPVHALADPQRPFSQRQSG